jgi:hypothetical protein
MGSFTPHRGTHRFISNDTPISWESSLLRGTQRSSRLRENDTPISWASSLHRGTQRSISVSERNNTPISWAHPTHGLSHRPTHSVCVLKDVSRSCNHQQPTFLFDSSSLRVSLLRTSLDENELSRGVNPFGNFSSSIDMVSLGLNSSFCMKAQMPSSLGKTYHDSTLSGMRGRYKD